MIKIVQINTTFLVGMVPEMHSLATERPLIKIVVHAVSLLSWSTACVEPRTTGGFELNSATDLERKKKAGLCHLYMFVCSDHNNDRIQTMIYSVYVKLS